MEEDYTIKVDPEVDKDIEVGVTGDRLDLKLITKWFTLGTAIVIALIIFATQFAQYALQNAKTRASEESSYEEITRLHEQQLEKLNSFGIIDADNGIYHMPIDQAIDRVAVK